MASFYENDYFKINKEPPDLIGKGLDDSNLFSISGGLNYNTGNSRIQQSIRQILITPLGSRFFEPNFGSQLNELIFEPNQFVVKDLAELYVRQALAKWEHRIKVTQVQVDNSTSSKFIFINIAYTILSENNSENYVFTLNRDIKEV